MAINRFFHNFSSSDKMNTRNKKIVLSGIIAVFLAMSLSTVVLADTSPMGSDSNPRMDVWVLKKSFSFCQDNRFGLDGFVDTDDSGQVPDIRTGGVEDVQVGCIQPYWAGLGYEPDYSNGDTIRRGHAYAFTGEQVAVLAVARDSQGVADLQKAFLSMGTDPESAVKVVQCIPLNLCTLSSLSCSDWRGWNHVDVENELAELPRALAIGDTIIDAGFNPAYDQIYECIMTVTDDMSGLVPLFVEATGGVASSDFSEPETFAYNPAIGLTISTTDGNDISFPAGIAGKMVYSNNKLKIENILTEAYPIPLDVAVWLGGTDLTASSGYGLCPVSNVLDSDNMKFRCTLNDGMGYIEQTWQNVENKDLTDEDGCSVDSSSDTKCFGLHPLFVSGPEPMYNILVSGQWATCDFSLKYPVPCIGTFDQGNLIILMRVI